MGSLTKEELEKFVARNKEIIADLEKHIYLCDDKKDSVVLACCLTSFLKRIMVNCMNEQQIDTILAYLLNNLERKKS